MRRTILYYLYFHLTTLPSSTALGGAESEKDFWKPGVVKVYGQGVAVYGLNSRYRALMSAP